MKLKVQIMAAICSLFLGVAFVGCSSDDEPELNTGKSSTDQPAGIDEGISAFFADALNSDAPDFFRRNNGYVESGDEDAYRIVNSMDEFKSIYEGEAALPEIDFGKYSLVIGRARGTAGFRIVSQGFDGKDDGIFNLTFEYAADPQRYVFQAVMVDYYFWGLYPKMERQSLTLEKTFNQVYHEL